MEIGMCQRDNIPTKEMTPAEKPPMDLQHSEKISHPEAVFSWPINKIVY